MVINEQKQNDVDIVVLSGRFVMENAQEVKGRIHAIIRDGQGKLLLDIEKVSFIDSTALAVLVSAYKDLQLKAGHLVLITSPVVQSLLELTRLHTIFEIMPNQGVALEILAEK
jgi:anti-sigma B factor antagonist